MANKERTQFAVIGLGRFGHALALKLYEMNKDVLAVDISEEKTNAITDYVTHAIAADATEESVLKAIGIKNFDVVVVCIGNNMQASILVTLICKQLGVKYVVAKAQSEKHKNVLEKIGADLVVFPEDDMGKKIAGKIANPYLNDFVDISGAFKMVDLQVPKKWAGYSLQELDLRKTHKVSVITVRRGDGEITFTPGGDTVLNVGDSVIIGGETAYVEKLSNKLAEE